MRCSSISELLSSHAVLSEHCLALFQNHSRVSNIVSNVDYSDFSKTFVGVTHLVIHVALCETSRVRLERKRLGSRALCRYRQQSVTDSVLCSIFSIPTSISNQHLHSHTVSSLFKPFQMSVFKRKYSGSDEDVREHKLAKASDCGRSSELLPPDDYFRVTVELRSTSKAEKNDPKPPEYYEKLKSRLLNRAADSEGDTQSDAESMRSYGEPVHFCCLILNCIS